MKRSTFWKEFLWIILVIGLILTGCMIISCKPTSKLFLKYDIIEANVSWNVIYPIMDLRKSPCQAESCNKIHSHNGWKYPELCDSCRKHVKFYFLCRNQTFEVFEDDFVHAINQKGQAVMMYYLNDYDEDGCVRKEIYVKYKWTESWE